MKGSVFRRCTSCGRRPDVVGHDQRCAGRASTWAFRVDVGKGIDGRRIQRRGGGFDTRREAERAMREVLSRVGTSSYVEPSARTLANFLTEEWLPTQTPPRVSANRYRNIRNAVARHLVPHLGRIGLQDLNATHLDRFYGALLRGGAVPGTDEPRRPLAPATVLQVHGVVRKALRDALKWGLVEVNVATLAEPPSNASVQAARRQAIRIWTPDELIRFLDRTREHWLHPMWVLATTTGLRRGELTGVVDNSLDLDNGRLVVEWQLVPEEQVDRPGVTTPVHKRVMKSSASSRTIDLDSHTVAALRRWRVVRSEWQLEFGLTWRGASPQEACRLGHGSGSGHGTFLFCWPDGRHLNPDWVSHEFRRVCAEADVPAIRPHDVRHTHASLTSLAGGEHLKVVQERLGWASSAFMLQTYTHLMPGMQRGAAERFAAGIFTPPDPSEGAASG